jgi:hypothetical protein
MTERLLILPRHRIQPGSVIALAGPDGARRTITLPDDVQPGGAVQVEDGDLAVRIEPAPHGKPHEKS